MPEHRTTLGAALVHPNAALRQRAIRRLDQLLSSEDAGTRTDDLEQAQRFARRALLEALRDDDERVVKVSTGGGGGGVVVVIGAM
jgi:hypothetical protein